MGALSQPQGLALPYERLLSDLSVSGPLGFPESTRTTRRQAMSGVSRRKEEHICKIVSALIICLGHPDRIAKKSLWYCN